jgi:arylsulfatase A-like enzyme
MWPHQTGCTKNGVSLDPRFPTFAELIGGDSYHPAYMGKWQLGDEAKRQRGFRDWISTEGASDYSQFLDSKGYIPDKPNGSFSERLISQLPLDISKPDFSKSMPASSSRSIASIHLFYSFRSLNLTPPTTVLSTSSMRLKM